MTDEERQRQLQLLQLQARARLAAQSQGGAATNSAPKTGFLDQTMSGVNEGLAQGFGFPVDAVTGLINAMTQRPSVRQIDFDQETGRPKYEMGEPSIPAIEKPVGGADSLAGLLDPLISDTAPQTTAQSYGRRIGQEVGASAPMALGIAGAPGSLGNMARSNLPKYAQTESAGAIGAGTGAAIAQDVAPGNPLAELLGQFLGGTAGVGASYSTSPAPKAPSMDDLRARQSNAYGRVDASTSRLTPQATGALQQNVTARSARDAMDPILAPKASRTAGMIGELQTPTIGEVEKMRRLAGRVAGNADPTESGLGMGMKSEITDYLDNLSSRDVSGGDPEDAVSALREGRDATRRIKASETVSDALERGERRAATSGTGGNEVNAIRQNLRSILDNPKKRSGFTAEELAAMEDIVRGTPTQNALRMLGRFSPTSGALPAMGGVGATGVFGPWGAVPSVVGMGAKGLAERSTQKNVSALQELIRNGAPVAPKTLQDSEKSAIAALLASYLSGASTSQ